MRSEQAVRELQALLDADDRGLGREDPFLEWQAKCASILRAAFGAGSPHLGTFFEATTVKNEGYTLAGGINRDLESWRADAAGRGRGALRAAIYALETVPPDGQVDESSFDPELWTHVQGLLADEDWAKVPAAVAIFVEHKVRVWSGDPRQPNGGALVGEVLYARALDESGVLRLGRQGSEWKGWRSLATGLTLAYAATSIGTGSRTARTPSGTPWASSAWEACC